MTKAELECLYKRIVGALDDEFRQRGWLPPGEPQTSQVPTFDHDEAYELFLVLDSLARSFQGKSDNINHLRERLLPVYREWHKANPHMAHPALSLPRPLREGE